MSSACLVVACPWYGSPVLVRVSSVIIKDLVEKDRSSTGSGLTLIYKRSGRGEHFLEVGADYLTGFEARVGRR